MTVLAPVAGCGLGVLTRGLSWLTNAPEPLCVPRAWLGQAPVAPAAQQGGSGTGVSLWAMLQTQSGCAGNTPRLPKP